MNDLIPWIIGLPILIPAAAGVIGFFGILFFTEEGQGSFEGIFRIIIFFVVAYFAYDFFIGYENPII